MYTLCCIAEKQAFQIQSLGILKPLKISLPNSNHMAFTPQKSNNASGSGFPPSLIPALRNIGILHHKKAELRIILQHSVLNTYHRYQNSKKA